METNTSNIIRGLEQKYFNGLSVYVFSYQGMRFIALHDESKKEKINMLPGVINSNYKEQIRLHL